MTDLTVFAEGLISTVARAFYDDEVVCLIDVLIRDKFLRDDDMAPRLQLPVKKLRSTLQFLQSEHIVKEESVDDLHEGGSQATRFFYIDYCTAVHSIRLRLHLLRQKLEKAELQARSSSFYLCPGYKQKRCNGRYNEEEAQRVLDFNSGLFLCQECARNYENDPNAPQLSTYTLQLVDNEKDLKLAMDNVRRLNVQLSGKSIGNHQLRPGIYDWLQKVRGGGGSKHSASGLSGGGTGGGGSGGKVAVAPITSNLPSENFALGIGSTRLAGTGRTAGIKAIKMQKQGLAESSAEARQVLVGGAKTSGGGGVGGMANPNHGNASATTTELMFLKSAHGHEIQFTVEKGGGARAQVLATAGAGGGTGTTVSGSHTGAGTSLSRRGAGGRGHRRRKLMDRAASRVGVSLPLPLRVALMVHEKQEKERKRKAAAAALEAEQAENKKTAASSSSSSDAPSFAVPEFLIDNIGRASETMASNHHTNDKQDGNVDLFAGGHNSGEPELILDDEWAELAQTSEEIRLATFQAQYKQEMERQERLLQLTEQPHHIISQDDADMESNSSLNQIPWEDGYG